MAKKRIVLCNFCITVAISTQLWLFETGQLLASHAGIFNGARRLQNSPYFCVFKYARAVKQKVWNEAENRERDWGETLKIRFFFPLASQALWACEARVTDFFTDFEKKIRLFCSLGKSWGEVKDELP